MTLSDYRNTPSWKGAIELGPRLIRVAEELPASEEMGLSLQLRQLMVELPAAIAADLANATDTRHLTMYKLVAALELVDHVYPALDTGDTKTAVDKLSDRLAGPDFAEAPKPEPKPAEPESDHDAEHPDEPEPREAAPAPALEPVPPIIPEPAEPTAEPATEAAPAEPAPAATVESTHIAVAPAAQEDPSVHPDISQQAQ